MGITCCVQKSSLFMLLLMKTFMQINVCLTEYDYNHPLEENNNYDNDEDDDDDSDHLLSTYWAI